MKKLRLEALDNTKFGRDGIECFEHYDEMYSELRTLIKKFVLVSFTFGIILGIITGLLIIIF